MSGEKRKPARSLAAEKVLSSVIWLVVLIGVLTVGYVLLPIIQFTFDIPILGTGINLGIVVFIVIAAIFSLTVIKFISSATALIGFTPDTLAKLVPNMTSRRHGQIKKVFVNFCFLVFIIIAYWAAAPFITLIPTIGTMLSDALKIVVIAFLILFFWSAGGMIYKEIEVAIGKIVVDSEEVRLYTRKVKDKVLKTIAYFIALISVVIASYAIVPIIRFSFDILIPTITVSVGLLVFVVILGILSFITFRFIASAATLLGLTSETFAKFMPNLASNHTRSTVRRIFVDFTLLIFVLIIYWGVYNMISLIPEVGIILANASQVVVAAILVVFFWDVGRTIYKKLEELTGRITRSSLG